MTHPNALASAVTTAIAAGLLALAHRLGYVHLSSVEALGIAGGIISAVLFVGRRGIGPTLASVWNGTQLAVKGRPPAPPPA